MAKVTSASENTMTPIEIVSPSNVRYERPDKISTMELEEQPNNKESFDGSTSKGNSSRDDVSKLSNQNSGSIVNQNQIGPQHNISDLSLNLENREGDINDQIENSLDSSKLQKLKHTKRAMKTPDKIFTVQLEEQPNINESFNASTINGNSAQDDIRKLSTRNNESSVNQNRIWTQQNISDISPHFDNQSGDFNDHIENSLDSLKLEKLKYAERAMKRKEKLKKILEGDQIESRWGQFAIDILVTILPCVTSSIPTALIPLHNILHQQEYWYESSVFMISYCFFQGLSISFSVGYQMNISLPLMKRNLIVTSLYAISFGFVSILAFHQMWSKILGYNLPIAFGGYVISLPVLFMLLGTTWRAFPSVWRKTNRFRMRMKYYVFLLLYPAIIFMIQLQLISKLLQNNQNETQVFISLLLPCIRELNLWITSKIIEKVADGDVIGANTYLRFSLSAWYTIALCFILGSMASNTTTLVLVGTDFTANCIIMFRIILLRKLNPEKIEQQIDMLQELAIYELVEFVAPTVVIPTFALLVHGPNCELIGNLCNSYWQFEGIKDMATSFKNMVTFWFVDILSTMITTITMKLCCGINILHIMMELLREFRFAFCVLICLRMSTVSDTNFQAMISKENYLINLLFNTTIFLLFIVFQYLGTHMVGAGMDWTMRFDWIDGNWNETMISVD